MNDVLVHPENQEQLNALKAFMKALKIKFEVKSAASTKSDMIDDIKNAVQEMNDIKGGKKGAVSFTEFLDAV